MAPSTYYAAKTRQPSTRARRDAELRPAMRKLWEDNYRVYGARKLWKATRRAGYDIGRDQTARLMRAEGIEGVVRTKRVRTTRRDDKAVRHPDLVRRDFTATGPNHLWVTDFQCRRRHWKSPKVPIGVRGLPTTRHRPSGARPGLASRFCRSHSWTSVTK